MRSIALILAGGKGRRMKLSIPKQFAVVDGMSVLQHTMLGFQQHELISAIYVVAASEWHETVRQQALEGKIDKFLGCATAGETGYDSLVNGIRYLSEKESAETLVMVHDSVRPLISQDIISRNLAVAMSHGNAITCIESQESYMVIDTDDNTKPGTPRHATDIISRERLVRAQTPQTFSLQEFQQMMHEAVEQHVKPAQSAFMLAQQLGHTPLYISQGETTNFKITHPQDLMLLEAILAQMQ